MQALTVSISIHLETLGTTLSILASVGLAIFERRSVKAYEITGNALDSNARVTDRVLTVKHLMEPLSRGSICT